MYVFITRENPIVFITRENLIIFITRENLIVFITREYLIVLYITDYMYFEDSYVSTDYCEVLNLILIYCGGVSKRGEIFMVPGVMHQAKWMTKIIYTFR